MCHRLASIKVFFGCFRQDSKLAQNVFWNLWLTKFPLIDLGSVHDTDRVLLVVMVLIAVCGQKSEKRAQADISSP
jgi:hypothetical protein